MNEGLKQRVVGALILSALALILWPVIMGPKLDQAVVIETDIPAEPEFAPSVITEPKPRDDVSPIGEYEKKLAEQEQPAKEKPRAPTVEPAKTPPAKQATARQDSDGLPISWIVQVGSFADREKADSLKAKLRSKGLRAQITTTQTSKGNLARVFLGPYVDKAVADNNAKKVARETGTKPIVVRYKR